MKPSQNQAPHSVHFFIRALNKMEELDAKAADPKRTLILETLKNMQLDILISEYTSRHMFFEYTV